MNKFIRNNQKKLLAVFSAFLMVIFIIQLAPQGQQSHATAGDVGTIDGAPVRQTDINVSAQKWQILKSLRFVSPNKPDAEPVVLPYELLGPQLTDDINRAQTSNSSTPLFYLLVEDARRQGVVVSKEQLESVITNNVAPLPEPGTDEREDVELAVYDCLMIHNLAERAGNVVKITRPWQQLAMAQNMQKLSMKFAPIVAARFLDKIPAPTDAQIQNQFDSYRDDIAAQVGENPSQFGRRADPLGFGYKVPNRVQLQYIGVNYPDLRAAVVAEAAKNAIQWDEDAFKEFKDNRADYDSRTLPDSALKSFQTMGPTTRGAPSTLPSTGILKLDNLEQDFFLHRLLVLNDLYDRKTDTRQQNIVKLINEKMGSGYGSYRDSLAAKTQTSLAAQYVSYKFMQNLAASLQSQFDVTPILGNIEQVKTVQQLAQIEGIGKSFCLISGNNRELPFPIYAGELFQPWLTDADKSSPLGALALALWQPSNVLEDNNRNLYVYRISGSDPAHIPPLADVKDQVISDYKTAAAYAQALEAGHKLLSSAQHEGLDTAATEAGLAPPILTDSFDPQTILSGSANPVIPPLEQPPVNLKLDSTRELAETSQQLLITSPGPSGHAQLLTELYPNQMVAVIELHEAKPIWEPDLKHIYAMKVAADIEREFRIPLELALYAPQAVTTRLNYQPATHPSQSP